MKHTFRTLLCLTLVVLLAALMLTGCKKDEKTAETKAENVTEAPAGQTEAQPVDEETEAQSPETEAAPQSPDATKEPREEGAPVPEELGEGTRSFYFEVMHSDGNYDLYEIHTDAETVGKALIDYDLVQGDDSEYGLYVKTVCGETLDYDLDGAYWAFYIDGEYAMTGVDSTVIEDGALYTFRAEEG